MQSVFDDEKVLLLTKYNRTKYSNVKCRIDEASIQTNTLQKKKKIIT